MPVTGLPRRAASAAGMARRRLLLGAAKLLLPAASLALLALLVVWPEFNRDTDSRLSYRRLSVAPESGELAEPRFRGVDTANRPYTITATSAHQSGQNRTDLVDPIADMTMESGAWFLLHARQGVYLPKSGQLDLAGEVTLYREDGLMLATNTATFDLQQGAGTSAERVHAEGPFGTLDAQGFAVVDKGDVVQFTGPGRLVLNEGQK